MAYVSIAPSDYDPDSPITTSLAGAWSNNLTEALAGTGGAPKAQPAALDPTVLVINNLSRAGVQTASGTTVLPLGLYYVLCTGSATQGSTIANGAQYLINGIWRDAYELTNDSSSNLNWTHAVLVASDGTNARVLTGVTYHKVL